MKPLRAALLVMLVGSFAIGASCDDASPKHGDGDDDTGGASPPADDRPAIESLEQVDLAQLNDTGKSRWIELANDLLSPCGEPVSVARCVKEERGCGDCVPAARYLARLVTDGYEPGEIEEKYRLRFDDDKEHELPVDGSPVRGSPMAPVTIVEFSDFECPFCAAAHPVLERVVGESGGKVRMVFKHYPLDQHAHARQAARAAIAAGMQGKFWPMHDRLFENQGALSKPDLEAHAEEIGLDLEQFAEDMESEKPDQRIDKDKALGRKAGVKGTPAVFVNGHRFDEPMESLPAYIEEELDR